MADLAESRQRRSTYTLGSESGVISSGCLVSSSRSSRIACRIQRREFPAHPSHDKDIQMAKRRSQFCQLLFD